eukprot:3888119-Pyramimonas_sp.AAC.2
MKASCIAGRLAPTRRRLTVLARRWAHLIRSGSTATRGWVEGAFLGVVAPEPYSACTLASGIRGPNSAFTRPRGRALFSEVAEGTVTE